MKRTIKIIALCLCVFTLTALFAGCDYLDDMKANHAILSEDMKTISFRGETYILLPEEGSFYKEQSYAYYDVDVTDEDVPVLLKDTFCYNATYYEKNDIFCVWINEDFDATVYSETFEKYFCNEKDYEKYVKALEENELDRIGFSYEVTDENYNWYYSLDVASEEVSKEILDRIKSPEAMTSEIYNEAVYDKNPIYLQCNLYKCDSEGILAEILNGYDIVRSSYGKAYLVNYDSERAVELSETVNNALEDKYFFGQYYAKSEDVYIIGEANEGQVEYI